MKNKQSFVDVRLQENDWNYINRQFFLPLWFSCCWTESSKFKVYPFTFSALILNLRGAVQKSKCYSKHIWNPHLYLRLYLWDTVYFLGV